MSESKNKILDARKKLGMSQRELGIELGLSSQQISNLENGGKIQKQTALAIECLLMKEVKHDKFSCKKAEASTNY